MRPSTIWLASFPRSGNTYLRTLLRSCFGVSVASRYDEDYSQFSEKFGEILGQGAPNRFNIVKTHDLPDDDFPAIYIVRDGRASIVSYFHYCHDFEIDRPIEDIIAGNAPFGSWSNHYSSWNPRQRPTTLFLKYEDIVQNPDSAIELLADFLNERPHDRFTADFSKLHDIDPRFFRSGNNARNIEELNGLALSLFDSLHSSVMRELGYYDEPPTR
ncbi:sulfotransferase domain-containing protein [Novosphingobium lentum]|uniref:sulfotransferase domain-containing protein n=1 Tax=Novosphingobium lentum TaxID=145287 RepID=UPI0034E1D432